MEPHLRRVYQQAKVSTTIRDVPNRKYEFIPTISSSQTAANRTETIPTIQLFISVSFAISGFNLLTLRRQIISQCDSQSERHDV